LQHKVEIKQTTTSRILLNKKEQKNIMHPRSWLDPQLYHPGQEKQLLSIATATEKYTLDTALLIII
jgi:hypothetical protein